MGEYGDLDLADELMALRAENARLTKALKYFTARETPTQWLYKRERAEELASKELESVTRTNRNFQIVEPARTAIGDGYE